jgi:hypothetical protein
MTRQLALPLSDDALHEYGLGRSLADFVAGGAQPAERSLSEWTIELCSTAALAWELWSSASCNQRVKLLFDNKQLCRFLMVHEDSGTLWFNKERFDELLKWMALQAAFDKAQDGDLPLVPVTGLRLLAEQAGYRVGLMLVLARDEAGRGV